MGVFGNTWENSTGLVGSPHRVYSWVLDSLIFLITICIWWNEPLFPVFFREQVPPRARLLPAQALNAASLHDAA